MYPKKTPFLAKKLYYSLIWDMTAESAKRAGLRYMENTLYLTFDDGPTPGVTERVLEILGKYNSKATFFCLGRNVERNQELYKQILSEGHAAGNHTYSHLKSWYTRNREYYRDIELAGTLIDSKLFRPPYGQIRRSQLRYLRNSYKIIMWDIMSWDFDANATPEKCLSIVTQNARPGSIIVFHDSEKSSKNMLYALPGVIEYFGEKGWGFGGIM